MNPAYLVAGIAFAILVTAIVTRIIYVLSEEDHETHRD